MARPCHTVVCAAPAYLKEHGTPRTVADLAHHNCIGYTLSQTTGVDMWLFGEDRKVKARITGSMISNNGDALAAAAIAAQGIVYMPTFLVRREIAAGLLVPLTFDFPPIVLGGVFAVYPAGAPRRRSGPSSIFSSSALAQPLPGTSMLRPKRREAPAYEHVKKSARGVSNSAALSARRHMGAKACPLRLRRFCLHVTLC